MFDAGTVLAIGMTRLHTGNVMLDSVLGLLVACLCSRLPQLTRMLTRAMERMWMPVMMHTARVDSHSADGSPNPLYIALAHYLGTEFGKSPKGSMRLQRNHRLPWALPVKGSVQSHVFEGYEILWGVDYVERDDKGPIVPKNFSIDLRCRDPTAMIEFTKEAYIQWMETESAQPWAPTFHTFHPEHGVWKQHVCKSKSFDAIVLARDTKKMLMDDVDAFVTGKKWYSSKGLDWKRGYLLSGPPGTGKTSIVRALCERTKAPLYNLDLSDMCDADLRVAFNLLPDKCVVLFDDVDCMTHAVRRRVADDPVARKPVPAVSVTDKTYPKPEVTLSCLLNVLDGAQGVDGRVIVMTSNHPELLDPALIRPGRIDMHVRLGLCTREMLDDLSELFYGADCAADCATLPEGVLSPASVTSAYMSFRKDRPGAHAYLTSLLKE